MGRARRSQLGNVHLGSQRRSFPAEALTDMLLDDVIKWIQANLSPEHVFDDDALSDWALDRGFVRETDKE